MDAQTKHPYRLQASLTQGEELIGMTSGGDKKGSVVSARRAGTGESIIVTEGG